MPDIKEEKKNFLRYLNKLRTILYCPFFYVLNNSIIEAIKDKIHHKSVEKE